MKMKMNTRLAAVCAGVLALSAMGATQIESIIKVAGIGMAVQQFGPQINSAINSAVRHRDTAQMSTKVVPILSAGVGGRQAIGAAQVTGPRRQIDQVTAVAQLDQDLFGRQVKARIMVPVSSQDVVRDIRRVDGVGVSAIVDLRL
jgi:hypothetical protein